MRRPFDPGGPEGGQRQDITEKDVEAAAIRLLARREHSTEELRRKLLTKGHPAELVEPVLQKLAGKRLVSDQRFASSYVHHHARRGQGPVRIRAELRRQGIDESRIEQELGQAQIDWHRLATDVRRRKFGAALPRSRPERAKQARFLPYRGFDADQIRTALAAATDLDQGFDPRLAPDPDMDGPDTDADPDSI